MTRALLDLTTKIPWDQKLVDCTLGSLCEVFQEILQSPQCWSLNQHPFQQKEFYNTSNYKCGIKIWTLCKIVRMDVLQ